ncbi:MAG: helix-turn-helix transcriptional regulator [Magnetovibrionaceae bacterium]
MLNGEHFPKPEKNQSRINWRVDDFCQAHGIGRTTFYELVKKGEIKTIKVGSRTLVSASEAEAWQSRIGGQGQ